MSYGSSGSRSSGPREMHTAVCDECGDETEVPFKPSPGRPVYCSDCFRDKKPARSSGDRRGGGRGGGRGSGSRGDREVHEIVCDDCGVETTVPFKPRGDKPVYCRDCFSKRRRD